MKTKLRPPRALWIAVAVGGLLILEQQEARAADIRVDAHIGTLTGERGLFNPKAIRGLSPLATMSVDYTYEDPAPPIIHWDGNAHAAAYGSDTWRDEAGIPIELLGLAVEPMADAQAHAFCDHPSWAVSSFAWAQARVLHRVIARPFPPALAETLEAQTLIPVTFRFQLHVSVQGPAGPVEATAAASVQSQEQPPYGYSLNIRANTQGGPRLVETNRIVPLTVKRHRTNDVHNYEITAGVSAQASSFGGVTSEVQAIADPLLEVDPNWQYAAYFTVVQESLQRPGEWIEITREWQNINLRPTLAITRTNSALALSWPADAGNFAVQVATNLCSPVQWSAVTNLPVLGSNTRWEIVLADSVPGERFYRLLSR